MRVKDLLHVYRAAAELEETLKVDFSFVPKSNIGFDRPYIRLVGAALCPCGNTETISVLFCGGLPNGSVAHHKRNIRLHHAWHAACFHAGIDPETELDIGALVKFSKQLQFKKQHDRLISEDFYYKVWWRSHVNTSRNIR